MNLDSGEATVSLHDITDRVRLVRALNHRANHDELTGLLNRTGFALAAPRPRPTSLADATPFGIALIDVVDFHLANDSLGHDAGDAILIEAARRMIDSVGDGATVARLGGDEFALLVIGDERHRPRRAVGSGRLRRAHAPERRGVHRPRERRGGRGIDGDGHRRAHLQAADLALAVSKTTSADQMVFFRPGMREGGARPHGGVERRRHGSTSAGVPVRLPACGRCRRRPRRRRGGAHALGPGWALAIPGQVHPGGRVPGELTSIFRAALGPALAQFARWREDYPDLIMNLNAHAGMLDDELSRWLPREAARAGLPLAALALELTERSLVPVQANASLGTLHDQGLGSTSTTSVPAGQTSRTWRACRCLASRSRARWASGSTGTRFAARSSQPPSRWRRLSTWTSWPRGSRPSSSCRPHGSWACTRSRATSSPGPCPGQMTEWLQTTHAVMPVDC